MGFLDKLTGGGKGKRVEPYGLWDSDAEQLERFASDGAAVEAPRDSEYSVSFTAAARAEAAVERLVEARVSHELSEPSHGVDEWTVVVYARSLPLVPDVLRDRVDLVQGLAADFRGTYEGWIALLTDEEKRAQGIVPL